MKFIISLKGGLKIFFNATGHCPYLLQSSWGLGIVEFSKIEDERGLFLSRIPNVQSCWKGEVLYQEGLTQQSLTTEQVASTGKAQVLGMEHPGVITLGLRGRVEKDILGKNPRFPVVSVQRGGEATIHNRGQLVIYPIVPVKAWNMGVRDFVELLMGSTEAFFSELGVETFRKKEPGLYTSQGKLAFLGLQVQRGITSHGLAINVFNDLRAFQNIAVCGVSRQPMDSLADIAKGQSLAELFALWVDCFEDGLIEAGGDWWAPQNTELLEPMARIQRPPSKTAPRNMP